MCLDLAHRLCEGVSLFGDERRQCFCEGVDVLCQLDDRGLQLLDGVSTTSKSHTLEELPRFVDQIPGVIRVVGTHLIHHLSPLMSWGRSLWLQSLVGNGCCQLSLFQLELDKNAGSDCNFLYLARSSTDQIKLSNTMTNHKPERTWFTHISRD